MIASIPLYELGLAGYMRIHWNQSISIHRDFRWMDGWIHILVDDGMDGMDDGSIELIHCGFEWIDCEAWILLESSSIGTRVR